MKRKLAFFWVAYPLQGLAESVLIGLLILVATMRLEGHVEWYVFQSALFFLCGVCGMWAVLRICIPQGGWLKQGIWELGVGLCLSLVMLFGLRNLSLLFKCDALWRLATWDDEAITLLLLCTGLGYFLARGGVRLWLRWDRMRSQRLVWSLTHAQLMVVIFLALLAALITFLTALSSGAAVHIWRQTGDPLGSFVTGLLVTFFPNIILITALTVIVLAVALPPSAVFSYFMARRTTRRLEALVSATAALRSGDYHARVPVEGEDEFAHLQADFNVMAEKLEATLADLKSERDTVTRVLQSRRDLIANVSHELRTPVATLQAAIETTLDKWQDSTPDEVRYKLGIMDAEVKRLSVLIDDLFTLAQADVNNLSVVCMSIQLTPLIQQVVDIFAPLAWNSTRVEVTADLPADLSPVQADAMRLQQVLLNLLRNGARHTPPGGIVAIMAEEEDATVRIEVRDTGEGIDPNDLPHIWERFYRGKQAAADSAGLGLALVKELVEAMDGSIGVESEIGQGSRFVLRLKKA